MTITEIQQTYDYPGHDWLTYLNSILPSESQIEANDTIIVGSRRYFEKLGSLLTKTSRRVLANYAMWRQASTTINYLSSNFRAAQLKYNRQRFGVTEMNSRWSECVDKTIQYFPHALSALYVRKHFKRATKEEALDMVKNIKEELKIVLDEVTWMDDDTKKEAVLKIEKMREQIGYADELLNDEKLTEYYSNFPSTIDEAEYFQSVLKLTAEKLSYKMKLLRVPIDKDDWTTFTTPLVVNGYYSKSENTIKFPAGILQGVFFNDKRPNYMNYGGVGLIIGHEITRELNSLAHNVHSLKINFLRWI